MTKDVQKPERNKEKILYQYGFVKMIITHELQKQDLSWQWFVVDNGFETIKEGLKEKEILTITTNEEDIQKYIRSHFEDLYTIEEDVGPRRNGSYE